MTALKGKLIQTIIYMAQGHTKRETRTVAVVEGETHFSVLNTFISRTKDLFF